MEIVPGVGPGETSCVYPQGAADWTPGLRNPPRNLSRICGTGLGEGDGALGRGRAPPQRERDGTWTLVLGLLHVDDALCVDERDPFARLLKHQGPQIPVKRHVV